MIYDKPILVDVSKFTGVSGHTLQVEVLDEGENYYSSKIVGRNFRGSFISENKFKDLRDPDVSEFKDVARLGLASFSLMLAVYAATLLIGYFCTSLFVGSFYIPSWGSDATQMWIFSSFLVGFAATGSAWLWLNNYLVILEEKHKGSVIELSSIQEAVANDMAHEAFIKEVEDKIEELRVRHNTDS